MNIRKEIVAQKVEINGWIFGIRANIASKECHKLIIFFTKVQNDCVCRVRRKGVPVSVIYEYHQRLCSHAANEYLTRMTVALSNLHDLIDQSDSPMLQSGSSKQSHSTNLLTTVRRKFRIIRHKYSCHVFFNSPISQAQVPCIKCWSKRHATIKSLIWHCV